VQNQFERENGLRPHHQAWLSGYLSLVGPETVHRVIDKLDPLVGLEIQQINSTKRGGGVAELLRSLVPMMSGLGLRTDWNCISASDGFFDATKKIHNLLQGQEGALNEEQWQLYETTTAQNSDLIDPRKDVVIIHDPQPLPLVRNRRNGRHWVWRCHIDLTDTNHATWGRLAPYVDRFDKAIFSRPDYAQPIRASKAFVLPAIDPFTAKNRDLSEAACDACLDSYGIPRDLPLVVQVSRFDPWKDPLGVIEACEKAQRDCDFRLVLLGNMADDDPEGLRIHKELEARQSDKIIVCAKGDDQILVNALQRKAAIVIQKSLREGFGLTVTEGMWKGRPVIAGAVGGITDQITNEENGILVSSVEETAERIVQLLRDGDFADRIGSNARTTVTEKFLMIRLLEDELDVLASL